jgi:hypothetical protein
MPISHIDNGDARPVYFARINEVIDAWHGPGTSAAFSRQGEIRGAFNQIAQALDLPGYENGESLGEVRHKINEAIDALNSSGS